MKSNRILSWPVTFRIAVAIFFIGTLVGLGEIQGWMHFIRWERPVSARLDKKLFPLAALLSFCLPVIHLAVTWPNRNYRKFLFPFLTLLVLQVMAEVLFSRLFFPSMVFVVAPLFVGGRLAQLYAGWNAVGKTSFSMKTLLASNLVLWSTIFYRLTVLRWPLILTF